MILYKGGQDVPIRENNSNGVYFNGSTWKTNSCGWITVVAQVDRYYVRPTGDKHYRFFIIKFSDGTLLETEYSPIRSGEVRNPNQPSVHGVGFPGQGKYKVAINGKVTKVYGVWHGMFQRCYSKEYHRKSPTYKGCTVHPRWHNFQNFCEDMPNLVGFTNWKKDKNKINRYELDKDIKIDGNREYSKDTCMFVTFADNIIKASITGLTYIGTRLSDGYKEEFSNQTAFSNKYHLHRRSVCSCVNGKKDSTGGWKFEIKREEQ